FKQSFKIVKVPPTLRLTSDTTMVFIYNQLLSSLNKSTHFCITLASVKFFEFFAAACPILTLLLLSPINSMRLSASCLLFPSSTNNPFSPSVIRSLGPHLHAYATIGKPQTWASRSVIGRPS